MYKIVAVDMDGTLLRNDKTISNETKNAIKLAKSKGVKIVLATGRPIDGVKRYMRELDLINAGDYVISFNGCLVQNAKTKEVISKTVLGMEDLDYLYKLGLTFNIDMHAFTNEDLVTPKMNEYTQVEVNINDIEAKIMEFSELKPDTEIVKFMMVGEKSRLDSIHSNLPQEVYDRYTVVRSTNIFLEFLNKNSNKGEAIKTLASHLNVDINDIICIGDAGNDYHMIKYAGLGVAMDNAFPEIKEIADYITKTNEEHGVAHVIEKFILAC